MLRRTDLGLTRHVQQLLLLPKINLTTHRLILGRIACIPQVLICHDHQLIIIQDNMNDIIIFSQIISKLIGFSRKQYCTSEKPRHVSKLCSHGKREDNFFCIIIYQCANYSFGREGFDCCLMILFLCISVFDLV